jgi:translation initiation factor IF-3
LKGNTNFRRSNFDPLAAKFKKNEFITSPQVRLVDEEGNPVGIVPLSEALEKAAAADMDLVEVAPTATPPVCKIISWSKFKYDQSKKQGTHTTKNQVKEVQFSPLIGENDRMHKVKRAREFLADKHMVKLVIVKTKKQGRIRIEHSKEVMNKVVDDLYEYGELESPPKIEGSNVSAMVKPLKTKRLRPETEEESTTEA